MAWSAKGVDIDRVGWGGVGRGPFREMKVANCFVFLKLLECHFLRKYS